MRTDLITMYTIQNKLQSKDIVANIYEMDFADCGGAKSQKQYIAVGVTSQKDLMIVKELIRGLPTNVQRNDDLEGDLQLLFS